MAQEEGFEPPTSRLTAGCSTTELLLNATGILMHDQSVAQNLFNNANPGLCLEDL